MPELESKTTEKLETYVQVPKTEDVGDEKKTSSLPGEATLGGLRVSLIPAEMSGQAQMDLRRSLIILGLIVITEILLIGGVYVSLAYTANARREEINSLKTELANAKRDNSSLEGTAESAATLGMQTVAAAKLLDNHVYWTGFLTLLERNTMLGVSYLNISADVGTRVLMADCLARDYEEAASQMVHFRNSPDVEEATFSSLTARVNAVGEVEGVSFSVSLKLKPESWRLAQSESVDAAGSEPVVEPAEPADDVIEGNVILPSQPPVTEATTNPASVPVEEQPVVVPVVDEAPAETPALQ